mmetsp:Transcript_33684/g.41283  ORF Transcript_33684/g.41283 Transcript_33684/m.41283 type:complete len:142 (-) Transcript_33684:298-723(-)|eukprot:CAMPEP_0172513786 /NCGR_PEP_ID=MMETSP1066-20121228/255390_1 /TAXON_ID=671091 /ORGANISM="Coscinodiscus wailesii, Strain CCMP2513" /LENGTH=141 /DNA_ID=CAMNT_0013294197 /DNA_START=128 /DNA_END=553 /DNA_ORIENTATION=+
MRFIHALLFIELALLPLRLARAFVATTFRTIATTNRRHLGKFNANIQSITSTQRMIWDDGDDNGTMTDGETALPKDPPRGSIEALALGVSLFFAATVAIVGSDLFATAPSPPAGQPVQVIDADALLRDDFERYQKDSSIIF